MSLSLYTGVWDKFAVSHLLKRTLYGATREQLNYCLNIGVDQSVNELLNLPVLTKPLSFLPEETFVNPGQTWVNSSYPSDETQKQYHEIARKDSLHGWLIEKKNKEGFYIFEKMCFFWHNHFAVSATYDSKASYQYHSLIENYCLGNVKELMKEMAINPNMLVFLNGNSNIASFPNENFARELLELYTVSKGELIAPGDYTNYTENDISEVAKIMTGWEIRDFLSSQLGSNPNSIFNSANHDTSTKVLSEKFNFATIDNANENEFRILIDIIFNQEATAKNICRKLYRYFVNSTITEQIESEIITGLASTFIANNYEIKPVLNQLLKSEHFFDVSFRGSLIKNPIEFCFSMLNTTQTNINYGVNTRYRMYLSLSSIFANMGLNIMLPPNVGGWQAYYHEPAYTQLWTNNSTLNQRFDLISNVLIYGGIEVDSDKLLIDVVSFLDSLSVPSNVDEIILECETIFFTKSLEDDKKLYLKTALLDGLPEFEWTIQYNEYLSDPTNEIYLNPIKQKMIIFLEKLFKLPEFQVI